MAKQKGLFKLRGTIGGVNYYFINGVGYARTAGGGFNGQAIRSLPSMQRVRENASEFGHCSRVKKAFRLALFPLFNPPKSSVLHRRTMSLFTQLKDLDGISARGQRRVAKGLETIRGKQLLQAFEFVPENKAVGFVLDSSTFDWPSQTLTIEALDLNSLFFPKGATHLALSFGVLDFDFETLNSQLYCAPLAILEKSSQVSSVALTPETVVVPSAIGLAVLGVQFYKVEASEVYSFEGLKSFGCQIVSIFDFL